MISLSNSQTCVFQKGELAKLAYCNDIVVGAVCCRIDLVGNQRKLYIMTLGCLAPYRRLGIGSVMLKHVLQYVENDGNFDSIYLWVCLANIRISITFAVVQTLVSDYGHGCHTSSASKTHSGNYQNWIKINKYSIDFPAMSRWTIIVPSNSTRSSVSKSWTRERNTTRGLNLQTPTNYKKPSGLWKVRTRMEVMMRQADRWTV